MNDTRVHVEHLIVLMLENRSYDHMLGYLPNGRGLAGDEYNLVDPADESSEKVTVSKAADYVMAVTPSHDFVSVDEQLFGGHGAVTSPAPMSGFVRNYTRTVNGDVETGKRIMQCFDPSKIPALTTLVREFCLCDHWHASMPGPTWPNRLFAHAGTSDGIVVNEVSHLYEMRTIYDALADQDLSWRIYYGDIPQSLIVQHGGNREGGFREFHHFHKDVKHGKLATYTFVEPRFVHFFEWKANDSHPPHNVKLGEYLVAEVYDVLRASRFWEKSLLVVLFDEHGGFFDRVSPPEGVPNPDGKKSQDPVFDFTRLGVRVPAVLVSPWVEKGRIDSTQYEHASLPAMVRRLFGLPESLTARDAEANTFEKNLSLREPRRDTPRTLPVPGEPDEIEYHRGLVRSDARRSWKRGKVKEDERSEKGLSPLQEALVGLADRLNEESKVDIPARQGQGLNEHEAAEHVLGSVGRFWDR
jgi:phospholipase C